MPARRLGELAHGSEQIPAAYAKGIVSSIRSPAAASRTLTDQGQLGRVAMRMFSTK
jgi:hypothetical protein